MRIKAEFTIKHDSIDKDKNRIFLSILKRTIEEYDKNFYEKLFKSGPNRKPYTFALYMKDAKFTRNKIIIPEKNIIFRLSTSDLIYGVYFYNAFLKSIGKTYAIKENDITINKILIEEEKRIYYDCAEFKTLSPAVVRKHEGDNKSTWYYSLNDNEGVKLFLSNLKIQLIEEFGQDKNLDINEVFIEVLNNREVKVKNYGIEVLGNLCRFKIHAKSYLLEYIYGAGLGSHKSMGFGYLELC